MDWLPKLQQQPHSPSNPMFLNAAEARTLLEFLEEVRYASALSIGGQAARFGLMISGSPGTGKALLAENVAARLHRPYYVVRLDCVAAPLLRGASTAVSDDFGFVSLQSAVIFLQNVDTVASLSARQYGSDQKERIVSALTQSIDCTSTGSVIVAASEQPDLLDPRIMTRLPYRIELEMPEPAVRLALWNHYLFDDEDDGKLSDFLALISHGHTGADIKAIAQTARRLALLESRDIDLGVVVLSILWTRRNRLVLPQSGALDEERMGQLAKILRQAFTGPEIEQIFGNTRQTYNQYLRTTDSTSDDLHSV
jgi:SpoVK/Ycf46/Vps4 family AAA+-type ATPase